MRAHAQHDMVIDPNRPGATHIAGAPAVLFGPPTPPPPPPTPHPPPPTHRLTLPYPAHAQRDLVIDPTRKRGSGAVGTVVEAWYLGAKVRF